MSATETVRMTDTVEVELIQTAHVKAHGQTTGRVSITDAVERAGLENAAVRFDTDENAGLIHAVGRDERRAQGDVSEWRNIARAGTADYPSYRVVLSSDVLEALDLDPDAVGYAGDTDDDRDGEGPIVTVWAGDGVLAFGHEPPRYLRVERPEDDEREGER